MKWIRWLDWPAVATMPVMLAAAMLGGAAWGGIARLLRARLEVNEFTTTVVLNCIAVLMVPATDRQIESLRFKGDI